MFNPTNFVIIYYAKAEYTLFELNKKICLRQLYVPPHMAMACYTSILDVHTLLKHRSSAMRPDIKRDVLISYLVYITLPHNGFM